MTRIRATCPACGEVELRPDDIELDIVRGPDDELADGSAYRFSCPECTMEVTKPADERVVKLLATGGVTIRIASSALPPHPEAPGSGPALTADDLLDLHLLLQQDDWFHRLAAAVS